MSRRHHGRPRHGRPRPDGPRTTTGTAPAPIGETPGAVPSGPPEVAPPGAPADARRIDAEPAEAPVPSAPSVAASGGRGPAPAADANGTGTSNANGINNGNANGCTAPQLRRFIKSRPYVPLHELRRRFAIVGDDDDVTQVALENGHVYVGLPSREGALLGELLRGGEIGYELSLDPRTPIVVGVYPMRPVPRG